MTQFDAIMEEHSQHLVRIAYLYVKDWPIAEDVVQDVFIKFFQTEGQFRHEASLKTYLTKMAANRAKDYLRSWKYKKHVLFENVFGQTSSVEEHIVENEQLATLEKMLFQLPLNIASRLFYIIIMNSPLRRLQKICS